MRIIKFQYLFPPKYPRHQCFSPWLISISKAKNRTSPAVDERVLITTTTPFAKKRGWKSKGKPFKRASSPRLESRLATALKRTRGHLLTRGPCVRFKAKSRIEIRCCSLTCVCLSAERDEGWEAAGDPGQFFPSLVDICRGHHSQRGRSDQRRTVIYSGRARSPWKM